MKKILFIVILLVNSIYPQAYTWVDSPFSWYVNDVASLEDLIPGLQLLVLPNRDLAAGSYNQATSEYVQSASGVSYVANTDAYGTWEFDYYFNSSSNSTIMLINDSLTINNGYGIYFLSSTFNRFYLAKYSSGSRSFLFYPAINYLVRGTRYRIKVTRSIAGVFTLYIKGGVFGDTYTLVDATGGSGSNPVTDNTYTTSNYLVTNLVSGDKVRNIVTPSGNLDLRNLTASTGTFYIQNANDWTSDNKVVQDYSQGGKQYGSDLLAGWDFTVGWTGSAFTTIISAKSFSTSSNGYGVYEELLTVGKKYRAVVSGTTTSSSGLKLINGTTGSDKLLKNITSSGSFSFEVEFQADVIQFYLRNTSTGTTEISALEVKEITNGSHGIYKNSMELNQTAGNKFLTFDGTDDYVSLGNVLNLQDDFTLMILFKSSVPNTNLGSLFGRYEYGTNDRQFLFGTYVNKWIVRTSGDGSSITTEEIGGSNEFFDSEPHFYGFAKNGATHTHQMDGVSKTPSVTGTIPTTLHSSTADALIGAITSDGVAISFLQSTFRIGLIIVANQFLSLEQQKQIYNSSEIKSIIAGM